MSSRGAKTRLEPDLDFVRTLVNDVDGDFKKCIQCGTCSGTCDLSPPTDPFPRKEMAWAVWGLKEPLLSDVDVWLCHQCNDCIDVCPRGSRPGDVLAVVRRECVSHYAFPRFFARWVNHPRYIPILLTIPAVFLCLALLAKEPVAAALGISRVTGDRIVYAYSSMLPHWVLNAFFGFFGLLTVLIALSGVVRFWLALKKADARRGITTPTKGFVRSIAATLKNIFTHEHFAGCSTTRTRFPSHYLVFFGFLALCVISLSGATASYNPLFEHRFVYPFNFWSPLKILANLGGMALVAGILWMAFERLKNNDRSTYADWLLLWLLLLVTVSGFASEVLHYLRVEPHRHAVYFVHLVLAFGLMAYLPYSKLAHLLYRTTAMVYAERTGRNRENRRQATAGKDQ